MKKVKMYGILVGAAILALSGCTKTREPLATSAAKETTAGTIVLETKPDPETTASVMETETEPESEAEKEPDIDTTVLQHPLRLEVSYEYQSEWDDGQPLFEGKVPQMYLLDTDYPKLQNALWEMNERNAEDLRIMYEQQMEDIPEMRKYNPDFPGIEFEREADIVRADQKILSIALEEYSWLGGAHPSYFVLGYNFEPSTGEALRLKDVSVDYDALYAHVLDALEKEPNSDGYFSDYKETVKKLFYDENSDYHLQWTMDLSGITIYFNAYEIAPYAVGETRIEIPFAKYGEFFDQNYVYTGTSYAKAVHTDILYPVDLDGDGSEESLRLSEQTDEEAYGSSLLIDVGAVSAEVPLIGYYAGANLLHSEDGRSYLYVDSYGDNDYYFLEIFELLPDQIIAKGQYENAALYRHPIQNPDEFVLYSRLDALSTYTGYRTYHLGVDGMPETDENVYELLNYQMGYECVITSIVELPVEIQGQQEMLPAGTQFHLRRTDGSSFVEALLDDGRTATIRYEIVDYVKMIHGMSEFDCFEELYYAG